ncbi:Growth-regulating factor 4 [Glycine soja]|uniref:Growth-regulating factor n=1 Tax=Glycine soja TaxID=3848 RepID=A0A445HG49_GLYSO|nr:growth-regulating factor 3-like isoform X1 [Glycine soja]KAG4959624.1 hypothetical protein JHK87_036257 [Glycine soja]RZB72664.1 Growth-regulating factor 4 isoform A [Glycine soja]
MDLQLKQWSNRHESEQEHYSPNMPKFLPQHHPPPSPSALPLFVPEQPNTKVCTLSAFSDSTLPSAPRFSRMESCFSFAQWQELELQALIFRYMLAGAPVPPELLLPIKKSFLQLYNPPLLESGYYWGRAALDPEPGRCRRTDGKKWRCSKDAVAGQKYCDRHMHRGRNRSRKPVEQRDGSLSAIASVSSSPSASFNLLHLSESSSGAKSDNKSFFENHDHVDGDGNSAKSDGHVLRHFFDDWPRTLQEPDNGESNGCQNNNSGTCLSMSTPGITSSDVSLKLSTGHGEDACHAASMGGPLAEALRSSTTSSTSSPTSVLLQLPPSSASEASFIST